MAHDKDPSSPGRPARGPARRSEGGIPDGLLLALLGFLLGLTLMTWTAAGLSGLFAHGSWPSGLSFTRTPLALRELMSEPHDLAGAWPDVPPSELSGYGLFWGILVSQIMVLIVLTVFVLGTVARAREVRARRRRQEAERERGAASPRTGDPGEGGKGAAVERDGAPGIHWDPQPPVGLGGPLNEEELRELRRRRAEEDPTGVEDQRRAGAPEGSATDRGPARPADLDDLRSPATGTAYRSEAGPGGESGDGAPAAGGTAGEGGPPEGAGGTGGGAPVAGRPLPWGRRAHLPGQRRGSSDGMSAAAVPAPRTPPEEWGAGVVAGEGARAPGGEREPGPVERILDAPGPVLVLSGDPEVWAETKGARAKLGPVHVFDPGHLCDTPARLRWSPGRGCQDMDVACARAKSLLAPVRSSRPVDEALTNTAETLLRCWLHATGLANRPFRDLHRWAAQLDNPPTDPVRLLRTHSRAAFGAAGELEATMAAHPERRREAQEVIQRALSPLSQLHVRNACNAGRADRIALDSFAGEGGTLYAMAGPEVPGVLPLVLALAQAAVTEDRAQRPGGTGPFDLPLTPVLDLGSLPQLEGLTSNPVHGLGTLRQRASGG
ncbi:hypothetical protein [Streptomyces sp. NPDC005438]|uniref:hypothetical protein n=1 Tax=Streptomyces sp. NPDC005438 TaxID=3156880 RepID=UPI0033BCA1DD